MKQGTFITKITMLALLLAVLAYLIGAAWRSFQDPYPTVLCYPYTVDDSAEATGLLVRTETVIHGQGGIIDTLPDQGERVGAGQTVAVVYRSEEALARKRELRSLELEIAQLNYSVLRGDTGWDNARLDESIVSAIVGLKYSAATGDLTGLEDQSLSLKSLILSREVTSGENTASVAALIDTTTAQLTALRTAATLDTTPVTVSVPGTFSALTDGYESTLTPAILETLTPATLTQLSAQAPVAPVGAVGKLITESKWYFVANLPETVANRLTAGHTVSVRFSRDWSGDVVMTAERISAPQNGICAVTLSASSALADTSLLRKQTVDIVFSSTKGIRIPKNAMRDETRTETDKVTGEVTREYKVTGVYVLTGAQAEFRPANVLSDDGDYFLVRSPDTAGKRTLRAGDEIIVANEPLFDGKVIR